MYNTANFSTYIYRVLKQVHPDQGLSGDGLVMLNNIVRILLFRSMKSVNRVMVSTGTKTISAREVQTSVKLLFSEELAKHSLSDGFKAVTKYNAVRTGESPKKGADKSKATSRSSSAGLVFPVTRIENIMRSLSNVERVSGTAAVFMAAVLEYVTAEILEIAGRITNDAKKVRITPRHIKLAILNDEELTPLFSGVVLSGGVSAYVEESLVKHKTRSVKKTPKVVEADAEEEVATKKVSAKKIPPKKSAKTAAETKKVPKKVPPAAAKKADVAKKGAKKNVKK